MGPLTGRREDKHPEYIPHLTVGKGPLVRLGYEGPKWTVDEVVLLGAGQRYEYTVLDRIPLGWPTSARQQGTSALDRGLPDEAKCPGP